MSWKLSLTAVVSQAVRSSGPVSVCERLEDRRMMSVAATEVPIPTAAAGAQGITRAKDGNYYFAEENSKLLGRITPQGQISEFPLLGTGIPKTVAQGTDGNIYVAQTDGISVFSPRYRRTKTFLVTPNGGEVRDIIAASDGALWFTEINDNAIGRLFPDSQKITEFDIPTANSQPYIITQDKVGALWFTEQNTNKIGHVITRKGQKKIVDFSIPTANSAPAGIVQGPDGNIWFAENAADKIGKTDPLTGVTVEFTVPTASSAPLDVIPGTDGNIYFSENLSGLIGSITPSGSITEFNVLGTQFSGPVMFAAGPSGTFFLTEHAGNNIAGITYP